MKRISLATILVLAVTTASFAAKAPVKKPAPRIVKGTTQLNGDQAVPGVTFTLGKTAPINVTVDKLEYTVGPVNMGSKSWYPSVNDKYLVVHYTLHNPNKADYRLGWNTLKFTVVDSKDQNYTYCGEVGVESTRDICRMSLKPAQKSKFYTIIPVPAAAEMPKLMIESGDHLVLRYDLRSKVTPIAAPYADPSDTSGATALAVIPAQLNTYYTAGLFDIKLDSVSFADQTTDGKAAKKGKRFLNVVFAAKNISVNKERVGWSTFKVKLLDQDGMEIRWDGNLMLASRDEKLYTTLEPGQEIRGRYSFEVPSNLSFKSFEMKYGNDGRAFVFDMSNAK